MSLLKDTLKDALREDIGKRDITSELIIPKEKTVNAVIITREACVVCGLDITRTVFKTQDKKIKFSPLVRDGQYLKKGGILARIEGKASSILTAERVALNFLTLLSGIATKTREFVKAVRPYQVKILDTRKTIPGLRKLQKYAVRIGGGYNHRMSLSDMVLIKDNHIKVTLRLRSGQARSPFDSAQGRQGHPSTPLRAGKVRSIASIVEEARRKMGKKIKVEIEVKNLREFKEVLKAAPDIIMLDNMRVSDIKKAVKIRRLMTKHYPLNASRISGIPLDFVNFCAGKRYTLLEASGGITLKNINRVASTGIDMISVGRLTHSVKSIDMSLEIL
jgi:nicotinate-nucleotide pyrophosphorylase (carboxylating)